MLRQVKQQIKDDIDLIDTAFPNPSIKSVVIERYLQRETIIEET